VRVDLSSREAVEASAAGLGDELDRIDVLINNAGEFTGGTLDRTDADDIYATVQANLAGLLHLTSLVLPGMLARGRGKIVNQASIVAYAHFPGTSVYAATKAGVAAATAALRRELDGTGVTTLELITGGYDTDMLHAAAEQLDEHADPSSWDFQDPDEYADAIVAAIAGDKDRLEPKGRSRFARLAALAPPALLDAASKRAFDRG
jgi:short-subunit dehydrogenase